MKQLQLLAILLGFLSFSFTSQAQPKCQDPAIEGLANNIKSTYQKQGLKVFRESMLDMVSMEPTPIAVSLQEGTTYQFIFIGSNQASKLMLELFDGADKRIDQKTERGVDYITYSFTPKVSEVYLITLIQKKGAKNVCGYFAVLTNNLPKPIATPQAKQATPATSKPIPAKTPVKTVPASTTPKTLEPKATPQQPIAVPASKKAPAIPDNQRPNPNRTKATQDYQQQQKK